VVAECIADIAFVIDNSGSIRDNDPVGGNNWQLILDFVKSIVELFTFGSRSTRIAVVDFGRCRNIKTGYYLSAKLSSVFFDYATMRGIPVEFGAIICHAGIFDFVIYL